MSRVFFRAVDKLDIKGKVGLVRELVFLRMMLVMLFHNCGEENKKKFEKQLLRFYKDALEAVNEPNKNYPLIQLSEKTYFNIIKKLEKGRIK